VLVDMETSAVTYVNHAIEMPGTGGNGNGLCEAGETCIYAPNAGAYIGHGTIDPTQNYCNYSAGAGPAGITVYGYPSNGY
jgi:hypothetical protein